ncbi:hypothetical protein LZ31DRAFT_80188 [Colletotrichum somersetense]|nr:hypothetical protein LZ31DRAFT_80188 [Colletotrichum somersetense]
MLRLLLRLQTSSRGALRWLRTSKPPDKHNTTNGHGCLPAQTHLNTYTSPQCRDVKTDRGLYHQRSSLWGSFRRQLRLLHSGRPTGVCISTQTVLCRMREWSTTIFQIWQAAGLPCARCSRPAERLVTCQIRPRRSLPNVLLISYLPRDQWPGLPETLCTTREK